jgi:hypothetical protein
MNVGKFTLIQTASEADIERLTEEDASLFFVNWKQWLSMEDVQDLPPFGGGHKGSDTLRDKRTSR